MSFQCCSLDLIQLTWRARGRLTKAAVDDLWASFNSGADDDPYAATAIASTSKPVDKPKKIKITVSYDFVGERIT